MSQCLRLLTTVGAALFVASCQTSTQVNESAAPTPVDITTTVADTEGVIPRFTEVIWPAVAGYNMHTAQGGEQYVAYIKIIAPDVDEGTWINLRSAVQGLGTVAEADETHSPVTRDGEGLHLASTNVTAETATRASLDICYTYTTDTYGTIDDPPVKNPAASEATVELRKTDNWYLYAITNDHVVAGCSASSRA